MVKTITVTMRRVGMAVRKRRRIKGSTVQRLSQGVFISLQKCPSRVAGHERERVKGARANFTDAQCFDAQPLQGQRYRQ